MSSTVQTRSRRSRRDADDAATAANRALVKQVGRRITRRQKMRRSWQLYLMILPPAVFLLVFNYWPILGIQIAFKTYNPLDGIWNSPWVGLDNIERFIQSYQFWPVIRNTLVLHLYDLLTFPLPIILAISLNYLRRKWFRNAVQMITYAPHFISTVVVIGLLVVLLDPQSGIVHHLLSGLGIQMPDILTESGWFRHLYVWSGVWQTMGFSAIVYLAALAGVDPLLHESAIVDGASKLRRAWHIDLPAIAPVAIILLILSMGNALKTGFQKVLLLQNPTNLDVAEVIDTYVYKVGLQSPVPLYSYATAIGLFQSVVGFILVLTSNRIARRVTSNGLW